MINNWLSIGEASSQLGVSSSTLRLWDCNNIFKPDRVMPSGKRLYSKEQVDKQLMSMIRKEKKDV